MNHIIADIELRGGPKYHNNELFETLEEMHNKNIDRIMIFEENKKDYDKDSLVMMGFIKKQTEVIKDMLEFYYNEMDNQDDFDEETFV